PEPRGPRRPLVRELHAGRSRGARGRAPGRRPGRARHARAGGAMSATLAATYEQSLLALAAQREDVVVMTAENRAHVRNLPAALGPRFVDVGICEQTLVGAAAGLALRGRTPVVHALASFLTQRAFEFIRTDVGVAQLPVKLVGFVPGLLSEANGPTHQAI